MSTVTMKEASLLSLTLSFGLVLSVFSSTVNPPVFPVAGQQQTITSTRTITTEDYFKTVNSSSSILSAGDKDIDFGAWASYQVPLELMDDRQEQRVAIKALLKQGVHRILFYSRQF